MLHEPAEHEGVLALPLEGIALALTAGDAFGDLDEPLAPPAAAGEASSASA